MSAPFVVRRPLPELPLWDDMERKGLPGSFELELTARCNNDCRHCYINLPASDQAARAKELTLDEICRIADQAIELGALWCVLTGGEPLLRPDFEEIYVALKRRGLLVSLFTNACLVKRRHVDLFRAFPPRDIEVTLYGATRETYERVTRVPGSFAAFERGVKLLGDGGVGVRYKAMALRSNVHELSGMAAFGRAHTKDIFRFDPLLHLRYDRDEARNAEIRAERLSPEQIIAAEQTDARREVALRQECRRARTSPAPDEPSVLFQCDLTQSFTVGFEGSFRLCSSLWHPDCVGDVRSEPLAVIWRRLVPAVRRMTSQRSAYREACGSCTVADLCLWCPAHADLETGSLDQLVEYFCAAAHARTRAFGDADIPS